MTALELFRSGLDTKEIAQALTAHFKRYISEAVASRMLHEQRCAERGLAVVYERHVRRSA